jgi:hypothetical protein
MKKPASQVESSGYTAPDAVVPLACFADHQRRGKAGTFGTPATNKCAIDNNVQAVKIEAFV